VTSFNAKTRVPNYAQTDPRDFSGLVLWLDAEDPSNNGTQFPDGTALATWKDKSGKAAVFTQSTGSLQPIYKTNILNGKPIVRFDGVDDYMPSVSAFAANVFTSGTFTIFIVGMLTSVTGTKRAYGFRGTTISDGMAGGNNGGKAIFTAYGNADYNSTSATVFVNSTYTNLLAFFSPGSQTCTDYKNEAFIETISGVNGFGASLNRNVFIGAGMSLSVTADSFWGGDIAEMIIYNNNMLASNKNAAFTISRYLALKWGLTRA
jgi:hypothetical protein